MLAVVVLKMPNREAPLMRFPISAWLVLLIGSLVASDCARVSSGAAGQGAAGPEGSGLPGGSGEVGDGGGLPIFDASATAERGLMTATHSVCGDGVRGPDEACDDGNTVSGDGCAADCLTVEPGYSCAPEGHACHRVARCGDGVVVPPELCDDRNQTSGDGCSSTCKVEIGFKCSGKPSVCTPTVCGDKIVEGAESCDDGNALPFDGCSADCQSEPDCTKGACLSRCGDGIVVGEECDDGNTVSGDGCSSDCKIEPGYTCQQPALGAKMLVPVIYRDFRAHKPAEFEPGAVGRTTALTGIVMQNLDADGKPVYSGAVANSYITSAATFAEWYRDTPGVNHTTASKLTLWNNGKGAYVNRFGPNGEPWPVIVQAYYCGNVGSEVPDPTTGLPTPCTAQAAAMTDCDKYRALGYTLVTCVVQNGSYVATYQSGTLDGTPLFFPVDSDPFTPTTERSTATIGPPYDPNFDVEKGAPLHNFSFTSQVRYWFKYDATKTFTLDFTGDDDVWLFINKQLGVDLGGIHTAVQGSVTFGAGARTNFGLMDGQVYQVDVFQAERQTSGSSYRLTLSGFSAAPSACTPVCGDGIVGLGEECDDGTNAGGYGQCGPGCKLGPYCGDGIVQPDHEDCDDGVNIGHPCPSGCKILKII